MLIIRICTLSCLVTTKDAMTSNDSGSVAFNIPYKGF